MLQKGSQGVGVIIQVIKVKRNEMGGACGTYDRHEKCIQGFDGGTEGNRPFGTPWSRWDDNIKTDLQDVGWGVI